LITKKGGWESAIADYSEAIKLDPNLFGCTAHAAWPTATIANTTSPFRIARGHQTRLPRQFRRGTIAAASLTRLEGNIRRRDRDYDQSISINPRNGVAYWNPAMPYMALA